MDGPIYLDYNATTPVDPRAVEAMLPYLHERFGNASSGHAYGIAAREAVERSRAQIAGLINAKPSEIVFTGGGSETNNHVIKGLVCSPLNRKAHIVSSVIEHPAVLNVLQYCKERFGSDYTLVEVDNHGLVSPAAVGAAIRPETVLVSMMHANNEVGTVQPISEIARVTREAGVLLHTDAAQSAGKLSVYVDQLDVDLMTIAGHKFYGPKGIGALYVRTGVHIDPLIHGSSQEHGMRAGTENVASIVGLGVAAELAGTTLQAETARLCHLRDLLFTRIAGEIPDLQLNGHLEKRLPNTVNVSFPHVFGQAVLDFAPEVAASTGSACHSGMTDPSAVLLAMGLSRERARGAVRLSLGRWTMRCDVERAASALVRGYRSVTDGMSSP
ncbi:MAG: cysteine desulfurase family protein [Chloroflexota bacterium]